MSAKGLLPTTTQIGCVRLAISDLSKSLIFYTTVLGLSVESRSADLATLTARGDTHVLVELQEIPGIKPVVKGSRLGLYHFAILLPSRGDLASFVEHLQNGRVNFGSSDHGVSEALYLTDPDGIQIEVYADRPRSSWTSVKGELQFGAEPLRVDELLAVPHGVWAGAPVKTTLGHLHFYVSDLEQARDFYCEGLGFDVSHSSYPGALFISAGGYHHHVGLNTWAERALIAGPTDARLLHWELVLEDDSQVNDAAKRLTNAGFPELVDPWQNRLLLSVRGGYSL